MTSADTTEARFVCAVCGEAAGLVRLLAGGELWTDRSKPAGEALAEIDRVVRPKDQAALVVETFYGVASQPVLAERLEPVARAIADADATALYAIAYSYAPFHCPECGGSYCGGHWNWHSFDDGDFSGIEGTCPQGHFHVLSY